MTWPKSLTLRGWAPKFEGCGDDLTLLVEAYRPGPRDGTQVWRGVVRVSVDRWYVRQLAQAIADMQTADRERIQQELDRLDHEVAPLTKPTQARSST